MSKSPDRSTAVDHGNPISQRFAYLKAVPKRAWITAGAVLGSVLLITAVYWMFGKGKPVDRSESAAETELVDVPARSSSEGPKLRSTAERPRDPTDNAIALGVGTKRLRIGASARSIVEMMGRPDDALRSDSSDGFHMNPGAANYVDPTHWMVYKEYGVALIESGGRVESIVFRFRNRTFVSFDGATEKGIGMWSTVNDVIRAYGNPDRVEKGYKHLKGADAAEHDFSYLLHYTSRATVFTFRNGELQAIVVGKW